MRSPHGVPGAWWNRRWRSAASVAVASMLMCSVTGCMGPSGSHVAGGRASGKTLTVFAAASLTDAFGDLAAKFEDRHGARVRVNLAGSSTLATQILRGAPADVYASADRTQMRRVRGSGRLTGAPKTIAENHLLILIPADNPGAVTTLRDLARPGVRLVLAADGVPVAEYTRQVLKAANAAYGQDFRRRVLHNVVSREADVRAAVNRVTLADADATFAYTSDVTPGVRKRARVVRIPRRLNVTATYPMGVLARADDKELARQWMRFVRSDTGQRTLRAWGFQPINGG